MATSFWNMQIPPLIEADGEDRLRSRETALQPAMALVEEQMSTTAFTPSISAVMR